MARPTFYVGLHQPNHAHYFPQCMISINRLVRRAADGTYARRQDGALRIRQKPIGGRIFLDSGAFTVLDRYGHYPETPDEFCLAVRHLATLMDLVAVSSQDYMCEPFMLARTGLSIAEHQRRTIDRYDAIRAGLPASVHVVPVIQGWTPADYVRHLAAYGDRLTPGMWVGVGSVCKRNGKIQQLLEILMAIHAARPDLRLHGYGLKATAFRSSLVRQLLHSSDSLAWSYAARRAGRDPNAWQEAQTYVARLASTPVRDRPYPSAMTV